MKITNTTTAKDLKDKTKKIMFSDEIPNMKLKDNSKNIKIGTSTDFKFWLDRLSKRGV